MIVGNDAINTIGARHPGVSYVVFGAANLANVDLLRLDGSNGFRLASPINEDHSGHSVASAGDVNGDGFDDLIVGAAGDDAYGSSNTGGAYVVFGKASGFASSIDLTTLDGNDGFKITGPGTTHYVESVATAGDINGDGLDDLIVGVPNASSNGLGSGSSYVVFGREPDTAVNRTGTDASQTLVGGAFDDVLRGLGGDDKLYGHGGTDRLYGGTGDDSYFVDSNLDKVFENVGEGSDTVYASVDYRLKAGVEVETLAANAGSTGLTLTGNEFDNEIRGGAGGDTLEGGAGADVLIGGAGRDLLTGGGGNDVFKLLNVSDSGVGLVARDVIRDFVQGSDWIDLSAIDPNSRTSGDDAFTFIGGAAFSHTAGEVRQFTAAGGDSTILAGDIDGDGRTDFQIAVVGSHTLNAGDFIL